MNQHPAELLPPPPADLDVFCTPAGHRLLVPRSATGLRYVLEEIANEPGRLIPCLLLAANSTGDEIFDEMDEDELRWRGRVATSRRKKKQPLAVPPPEVDGRPPRRGRKAGVAK